MNDETKQPITIEGRIAEYECALKNLMDAVLAGLIDVATEAADRSFQIEMLHKMKAAIDESIRAASAPTQPVTLQ